MEDSVKLPMCLISYAGKFKDCSDKLNEIISEYWSPKYNWKCCEYLDKRFKVLEVLAQPVDNIIELVTFKADYSGDHKLMKQKFPLPTI